MFQSSRFVHDWQHASMLQRIDPNGGPLGEPIHKTIGPSGILEITECDRNQQSNGSVCYPTVSKAHFKALYASYQSLIATLEGWLRAEWARTFEPLWRGTRSRLLKRTSHCIKAMHAGW